jgi:hypothetical protein
VAMVLVVVMAVEAMVVMSDGGDDCGEWWRR